MLSLAQAASYFDRTPILDPTTGELLFNGQLEPFDDSHRDAGAAYRRILSVSPGTVVPTVVTVHGATWVVGFRQSDSLGVTLRDKYVLQRADAASVSRPASFLAGTATHATWLATEWLKDGKEIDTSSDTIETFTIMAPGDLDLIEHDLVWYAGRALLAQRPRLQPSGYLEVTAVQLEQSLPSTASIASRTFNPANGGYTAGATVSVPCQRVRWQSWFRYDSEASARYKPGDATLIMPPGTAVKAEDRITFAGAEWKTLAVKTDSGVVCVHARGA